MIKAAVCLSFFLWSFFAFSAPASKKPTKAPVTIDANAILKKAEDIRIPPFSYSSNVKIEDQINGKKEEPRTYSSMYDPDHGALVKFLTPTSDIGKELRLIDNSMWISVPDSAKPLRVSAKNKLTGNAVYGDIAGLKYVGNYTATYERDDVFEGKKVYVLELTAVPGREITYEKVSYWVDKNTGQPLRAEFRAASGKILRVGYYRDYQKVDGMLHPMKLSIENFLNKNHITDIIFSNMKKAKFPAIMFKPENLGR